jgi:UDP-glucose 4-epimerase
MKIGITGGAGFIGANLARHLLNQGAQVTVIDNLSTGYRENIEGLDLEFIEGSILDEDVLSKSFDGTDAIVHLAALGSVPRSVKEPLPSHEANATGTLKVLEAAREQAAHVVVASSSSVYGANPVLPKVESMRPMPVSPYAVSKLAAESYTLSYQRVYGLPTLAFRFFNVFGPLQAAGHAYAAVVPAFTHAALRGEPLTLHGDGTQTRDFTYVGTVVETIADAIDRRVTSLDPLNLAFGTRHSLLQVVDRIADQVGEALSLNHVEPRAGDVRHSQADCTALKALFPNTEPIDLDTGLAATIAWMKSHISD